MNPLWDILILLPQPHNKYQSQGDDQLQIIPLHQQVKHNQKQKYVAAVNMIQVKRFEQSGQASSLPPPQYGG